MRNKIKITEEEYEAVKVEIKKNRHKRIDKKLQVIALRYEGMKCSEIGEKLGYSKYRVIHLCGEFKKYGISEYIKQKYPGNHRSLSVEEEDEILAEFEKKANEGQIVTAQEIKATPHKERLAALHVICLHIFRHLAQKFLDIRQYACKIFA